MITFQKYSRPPFEVVERKGLGHPDTLADAISEVVSMELSRFYLDEFGEILHHNVDKVLITAGKTDPRFGGGQVLEPPTVIVGGRATAPPGRSLDPVIQGAVTSHLESAMENLLEFRIDPRVREGAPELRGLMGKGANDTSIGVGFAPLDPVERLVLELEDVVRGIEGVGEDTKVMAVRIGEEIDVVVAAAIVSRYVHSLEEYEEVKARVQDVVEDRVEARVAVNAADTEKNIFLTVTGSSVEMGDDGATGRGNRGNGLITPMRPMSIEAIAGKNPVNHVGKIYNVIAQQVAKEIAELEGVKEAYVTLVSKIGASLSEPLLRAVEVKGDPHLCKPLETRIEAIVDRQLEETGDLVEEFVAGKLRVY